MNFTDDDGVNELLGNLGKKILYGGPPVYFMKVSYCLTRTWRLMLKDPTISTAIGLTFNLINFN